MNWSGKSLSRGSDGRDIDGRTNDDQGKASFASLARTSIGAVVVSSWTLYFLP